MFPSPTFDRAVVVGGSMAGLASAAVLASRFREVVVVERRPPEEGRSVAPHGHLPHVMLAAGSRVLEQLFPGFAGRLLTAGAVHGGGSPTHVPCYWAAAGTVRDHLALRDLGFVRAMSSRGLVESRLRTETFALPNVRLEQAGIDGLTCEDSSRITGVRLRDGDYLTADLVVVAAGRAGRVDDWIVDAGLTAPRETEVTVDLRYTAFVVERHPEDFNAGEFAVVQNTADIPRIGVALPMEGNCWQVVLGGYFGDAAPTDPGAARAFASELATPVLTRLLERPFLQEPARFTFRSSRRRHWETLRRPAPGLAVVGDALASFNPIYGQGMSAALLQAEMLGSVIDRHGLGRGFAKTAARSIAKVVDNPWLVATGGDFVYPRTLGQRPPGTAMVNRYIDRVTRAAATDETVNHALTEVQQLLAPPATLFSPAVARRALGRRGGPVPARVLPRAAAAPGYGRQ